MYQLFPSIRGNVFKVCWKEIVFVEIGVLHGGSLFMWKEYFGNKAK